MRIKLVNIEVENLHAFRKTSLDLDRERIVIVGLDNSERTALLALAKWLVNQATDEKLTSGGLRPESKAVLLPARKTRNRARRLPLVARSDGRTERLRYCVLTTRGTRGFLRPGESRPDEPRKADPEAIELLMQVREHLRFVHVPSFRDAQSERFAITVREAYRARFEDRALHLGRGRASEESVTRAHSCLRASKATYGFDRLLDTTDLHVEAIDLLGNRVSAEIGVAAVSALQKAPVPGLLVLGDLSIGGNVKPVHSLVEPLQVAMDNGARRALIPIENKRSFFEVSADVLETVDPIFFGDLRTAAPKALALDR